MTKALLSRHGVPYTDYDVENDAGAKETFQALGLQYTPTVLVADRQLVGWNPEKLSEMVGVEFDTKPASPQELIESLRVILDGALRAVRQIPDDRLTMKSPDRDRPLRQIVHHLFRVIEVGVDADVTGEFPARQWLAGKDIPAHDSADRLARFGEAVQAKFESWYRTLDEPAFGRQIDADVGPRTLTQVLQRTRMHSAQHLRQIYVFLEWCEIVPDAPVTVERMRELGLDLPDTAF